MEKRRSLPEQTDMRRPADNTNGAPDTCSAQECALVGRIVISGDWARKVRNETTENGASEATQNDYAEHLLYAARKSS
ncbi:MULTISPECIES: hypothetical protein [unclassified Shimia]|uniref:hypothetical protein n=1 Tax=unclassified Shimia TaxID=2630038 RepID=UPI00310A0DD6